MTKEKIMAFLKKVDAVCADCGYDTSREDPCKDCPVRKTCDHIYTDKRENIRIERGTFAEPFFGNGIELISTSETVCVIDALPDFDETPEDVAGYCDVVNSRGEHVLGATWLELEGIFRPEK